MAQTDLFFQGQRIPLGVEIGIELFGIKAHLEYPYSRIISTEGLAITLPDEQCWRGVYGYVSWGLATPLGEGETQIFWLEPQYINWQKTIFSAPPGGVEALRVWLRKGVAARYKLLDVQGPGPEIIVIPI